MGHDDDACAWWHEKAIDLRGACEHHHQLRIRQLASARAEAQIRYTQLGEPAALQRRAELRRVGQRPHRGAARRIETIDEHKLGPTGLVRTGASDGTTAGGGATTSGTGTVEKA